jgi:hypothetical protein
VKSPVNGSTISDVPIGVKPCVSGCEGPPDIAKIANGATASSKILNAKKTEIF